MKPGRGSVQAGLAVSASFALGVAAAWAQDADGLVIEGSVNNSLEINDNADLDETSAGTQTVLQSDVALRLISETPVSRLSFGIGGVIRWEDRPTGQERNGFENPFLDLNYQREGASSLLTIDGSFRTRDLDDQVFSITDEDFTESDLILSGGSLETTSLGVSLGLGVGGPLGAELSYNFNERTYSDTIDPDLFDRRTDRYGITATGRLSPVATARLSLSQTDFSAEDQEQTERTTTQTAVGIAYEINPVLRFDGEISSDQVEETETIGGLTVLTENDGIGFDMALIRELPNGSLSLDASRQISTNTNRTDITLGRVLDLRLGGLDFDLGVSFGEDGDNAVAIGSLAYQREFPTGVLNVSLSRSATVNDENEQRARTSAQLDYLHEVSPVSAVDFGVTVSRTQIIGGNAADNTFLAEVSIDYRREITEDWDWRIGYRGRYRDPAGGDPGQSNALVTSFGRTFSIRP